jgi:hypothetical protein
MWSTPRLKVTISNLKAAQLLYTYSKLQLAAALSTSESSPLCLPMFDYRIRETRSLLVDLNPSAKRFSTSDIFFSLLKILPNFGALLHIPGKPEFAMKRGFASTGGSVIPVTQWSKTWASPEIPNQVRKISLNQCGHRSDLSEIKLKRTDLQNVRQRDRGIGRGETYTTLDLSQ